MDTLRVMVADDEPGMRMGVARALRDFRFQLPDINAEVGFAVDQVETGEQALDSIHAEPPDILLLDYKLPGISGLDVLDRIESSSSDILTIMITAYATLETAVSATRRGAYDFLAKPFTPDELRSTVRKTAARLILTRQARRLAEEKRQVRFQFISVLAHELKAPLSAVEGYLQIMNDRSAGDDEAVYHQMVGRSIVRVGGMRKLINDLLDLTHIESGQKQRKLSSVNLCDIARDAIETAAPAAAGRNIAIELHAGEPVVMQADAGEIEIIMNNLVSNAVKYNRDDGRVDVTLSKSGGEVRLAVADTGIGMTQEDAAKLFNEFVRIKNSKTRNILGSGLGLSIVKKIAMLYEGDAAVQSEPDVGSTFTVVLKDSPPGGDE